MKNNELPQISTIVPVLNGARFIAQAIESIISQDYPNMEVIVIDDGSTDDTKHIVAQFGKLVTYYYQHHKGISAAMNHGITKASGEFIAFLDADDYWLSGKINRQMELLDQDASVDMVFSYVKQFYSPGLSPELKSKYACPENPVPGTNAGSMLIRRNSFFRVGLLDEKWVTGVFNDWSLRATEAGLRSAMLPDVFYMRRIHDANHGIHFRDKSADYLGMIRASLKRRKSSSTEL